MNGLIRGFVILFFLQSAAQNDSILLADNNKLFLNKTEKLLASNNSYHTKTKLLLTNYIYKSNAFNSVKKLYVNFLAKSCSQHYCDDVQKIFFAYFQDQRIREMIGQTKNDLKKDSLRKIRRQIDFQNKIFLNKLNLQKIRKISKCKNVDCLETLQNYFILVQHTDVICMKKNLPFFLDLSSEGILKKSVLALMIDRIETEERRPQIYGTQVFFNYQKNCWQLFEIIDEKKRCYKTN